MKNQSKNLFNTINFLFIVYLIIIIPFVVAKGNLIAASSFEGPFINIVLLFSLTALIVYEFRSLSASILKNDLSRTNRFTVLTLLSQLMFSTFVLIPESRYRTISQEPYEYVTSFPMEFSVITSSALLLYIVVKINNRLSKK